MRSVVLLLILAACAGKPSDGVDTDGDVLDTGVVDTDVGDTDTDVGDTDTDVGDTDAVDTDTDVGDTDVGPPDADGDGVADPNDACANGDTGWTSGLLTDDDADGCQDATEDADDDNDGSLDPADCSPTDPAVHPGATEVCNGLDEDCANGADDGLPTATWYADADNDGFGDPAAPLVDCGTPPDHVQDASDCDDGDQSVYPSAPETCGTEKDCDASTVPVCVTSFAVDVAPVLQAKCAPCHAGSTSGGHDMASPNTSTGYTDSQKSSYYVPGHTKGYAALARIQDGSMPRSAGCTGNPAADAGNPACLTAAEQATIQAWLDDGQLP